jgi:hypothetical protein
MPVRPPGQSDFVYVSPPEDPDAAEKGAPPQATKAVYWVMGILMILLFALVAVGLHVPAE